MPYFKIETNLKMEESAAKDLAKEASTFACKLLGKPEKYMMVSICPNAVSLFGGTADPTAYVELKSIGLLEMDCKKYSKAICEFLESNLGIPADRIYIDFMAIDVGMFGWNKTTFSS